MKPLQVTLVTVCLIFSAIVGLSAQTSSRLDGKLNIVIHMRNVDARELLSLVCNAAKLELDMAQDIKATVTVNVERPTLREALDAIVQPAGFVYTIDAGKLKVMAR